MPLRNTERVLKNAGVDRLLKLEHLERTERHAELFAGRRVFQRGLVQFRHRANRLRALRGNRPLPAPLQRLNSRAFAP